VVAVVGDGLHLVLHLDEAQRTTAERFAAEAEDPVALFRRAPQPRRAQREREDAAMDARRATDVGRHFVDEEARGIVDGPENERPPRTLQIAGTARAVGETTPPELSRPRAQTARRRATCRPAPRRSTAGRSPSRPRWRTAADATGS